MYTVILRCVRVTIFAVEMQYVLNMSACMYFSLVSGMQIANFLYRIILSSASCLAVPYSSHKQ